MSGVVLVDSDEVARDAMSAKARKLRGTSPDLEAALDRSDVTHVLVALPNVNTPRRSRPRN